MQRHKGLKMRIFHSICIIIGLLSSPAWAQGVPIGALPNATTPLSGSEYTILSQNGTTVKATVLSIPVPSLTIANNTVLGNVSGATAAATAVSVAQLQTLLGLGTSAYTNIGTSGSAVPLLSTANTWSLIQSLTGGINLSGASAPLQFNGSAGTSGNPMISQGAGATPSFGTRSGNTTVFSTTTGTQTNGNCVSIDASGNHIASGGACGTGVVVSGTAGQMAYYPSTAASVSGSSVASITAGTFTLATGGITVSAGGATVTGNSTITGTLQVTTSTQTPQLLGATTLLAAAQSGNTISFNSSGTSDTQFQVLHTASAARNVTVTGSAAGNPTISTTAGSLAVTPLTVFAAGINLTGASAPLQVGGSAGTSGYLLTSAGAGATPTWAAPTTYLTWAGIQTISFAAAANTTYCVTTTGGAVTMTLPAAPADGDRIEFIDCVSNFAVNALTVARNGKNIMGLAENMTVATINAAAILQYVSANNDWRLK